MKNSFLLILIFGLMMFGNSCKKEKVTKNYNSEDVVNDHNSVEVILEDADEIISYVTGKSNENTVICGLAQLIDSSSIKKYIFEFNGTSCNNKRKREGQVIAQLTQDTGWTGLNGEITLWFNNYKITPNVDGKWYVINGKKTIKNLSGNLTFMDLVDGGPKIKRQINADNMHIDYYNGTQRIWNESKLLTTEKTGLDYYITTEGNASGLAYSNVSVWGTNRKGNVFYDVLQTPAKGVFCFGVWKMIDGTHKVFGENENSSRETTIQLGVDVHGNKVNDCELVYGKKITWQDADGVVHVNIVKYN